MREYQLVQFSTMSSNRGIGHGENDYSVRVIAHRSNTTGVTTYALRRSECCL